MLSTGKLLFGIARIPFRRYGLPFTASVIVYRTRLSQPEGDAEPVSDLVPVWWEFHTFSAEGEMLNDFDFSEMKRFV